MLFVKDIEIIILEKKNWNTYTHIYMGHLKPKTLNKSRIQNSEFRIVLNTMHILVTIDLCMKEKLSNEACSDQLDFKL